MNRISVYSILLFFIFSCLPIISYSQDEEDTSTVQTEEIIVTGSRMEQKLIDIPFSVQRIDQSSWKSSTKMGINEVLTSVPGLFLQSRYGNHDVRVTIRGFGSRSNTGIRGVRILLDGIPESEPDGQTRIESIDFTAIGKIEIAKGNLSSLYTNAPGGVINFMSDRDFPGLVILSDNEIGQFDIRKNGLKIGYNSNKIKFMITGSYQNYKGYRNHSNEYQTRLNAYFETPVGSKSKISLYGYYVNGLIKLPGSLKLYQYNENDTAANARDLSRDSKRITKKGRLGITFSAKTGNDKLSHLFEVTTYGTIKDLERTAATYRIFNRYGIGSSFRYVNKLKIEKRTNEFSLGGDLYYQSGPIGEYDNISGQKGDLLQSLTEETISNVGFYGIDQFELIPKKLSLTVTGRYDRIKIEALNLQGGFQDTSRLFNAFTPKFALNLKITPTIAFYTSFGLGFDSPANNELDNHPFSSDGGLHTLNPDLQAQKSQNLEAGFKAGFKGYKKKYFLNTFAEMTFFYTKIKDAIVPFVVDNAVFYRNAAVVNRFGLEAGLNTEIIKGLKLKAAYTYSDFKYDEYKSFSIDEFGNESYKDYSGTYEPSNPKHMISADLSYQYTFQKYYTFFVKANEQYIDRMYVDDFNTDSLKTESYNLINAQIGVDITYKNFRILAFGGMNNILDKKYVAFININSDRNEFYESGPRRNFFGGLTLGYIFK
jgi:iron complex outermembrane recepter protein